MGIFIETASGYVHETEVPEFYPNDKRLTKKEGKRRQKEQALETLRGMIKPSDRIYCTVRHVARSGMSRAIDFYIIQGDRMAELTGLIALALDYRMAKRGLTVTGCGMDMGFAVVYSLGHALWPNGTLEPHGTRNGEPDTDGGYALKHEWL
jgi:hypothetical protein